MDASTTSDPDLPGFSLSSFTAPTGADDDHDARRLFWVPARLHPELAPEGWKAFVEAKVREIRQPGGKNTFLTVMGNQGPTLRRKKSMLSRQIDNTGGKAAEQYEDGADRLERRRSQSGTQPMLKVSDLENLVTDPSSLLRKLSVSPATRVNENGKIDEDWPILPRLGQTLRRSTRTTYRRDRGGGVGGLGNGRRKLNRGEVDPDQDDYLPGTSPASPKIDLVLKRVQTEPLPVVSRREKIHSKEQDLAIPSPKDCDPIGSKARVEVFIKSPSLPTPSTSFEDMLANAASIPPVQNVPHVRVTSSKSSRRSTSPSRTSHSRKPSQDNVASVPHIVETSPAEQPPQGRLPEKGSPNQTLHASPSKGSKRLLVKQSGPQHLTSEVGSSPISGRESPSPIPGETKDNRAGRSDSINSTSRKSSWGWLVGDSGRDREKEKEKEKEKELKEKERATDKEVGIVKVKKSKTSKLEKGIDKDHSRLDVIQKSLDGREGHPEGAEISRDKEKDIPGIRKSSTQEPGGPKKEKDSSLFSSIFGGSRKKSGSDSQKTKSTRNTSPDRSHVQQNFYYTRFPIHIERAIYRLSHLKLANPRRPLLQQVLLSNFMYSYLAKVQMQPTLLQQQQQQQQQQVQEQQQREYEQQQLYHQQRASYEKHQYEKQAEHYYQYDDVSPSGVW